MTAFEIPARDNATVELGGTSITVLCTDDRGRYDQRGKRTKFSISGSKQFSLEDVLDVSQQLSNPRIIVLYKEHLSSIVLLGRGVVYWVDLASGDVKRKLDLNRDYRDTEYWYIKTLETAEGNNLIIYEGGIMILDRNLGLSWHLPKYYDDNFEGIEGDKIIMTSGGETWFLGIHDGQRSD